MKNSLAIVMCLLTAAICVAAFKSAYLSAFATLQVTAAVWFVISVWLGNEFNPERRELRSKSIGEILRLAKVGQLPKESALASAMLVGGAVMCGAAFAFFR